MDATFVLGAANAFAVCARATRAVKPTLAAKRLKVRAEAILEDAQETTQAMRDESVAFAHQRNAVVTVAIIPTPSKKTHELPTGIEASNRVPLPSNTIKSGADIMSANPEVAA